MRTHHVLRTAFLLLVLVAVSACAANPESEGRARYDANLLTRAELEATNAANAYEAIERLRPRWLVARTRSVNVPVEVMVYFNSSPVGGVAALRQFSLDGIMEIRFLDPSQAQTRLPSAGVNLNGGAIQILTAAGAR